MKKFANRDFIEIRNAEIKRGGSFCNFSGRATGKNSEGSRNFTVYLDHCEIYICDGRTMRKKCDYSVDEMIQDGWNVKFDSYGINADDPRPMVQVQLSYGNPYFGDPKVAKVTSKQKFRVSEQDVGDLDTDEIASVSMTIRPRVWGDEERVKAYLRSLYVTIVEDDLDEAMSDIPWADSSEESDGDDETVPFD